jgi:hypothetical protein
VDLAAQDLADQEEPPGEIGPLGLEERRELRSLRVLMHPTEGERARLAALERRASNAPAMVALLNAWDAAGDRTERGELRDDEHEQLAELARAAAEEAAAREDGDAAMRALRHIPLHLRTGLEFAFVGRGLPDDERPARFAPAPSMRTRDLRAADAAEPPVRSRRSVRPLDHDEETRMFALRDRANHGVPLGPREMLELLQLEQRTVRIARRTLEAAERASAPADLPAEMQDQLNQAIARDREIDDLLTRLGTMPNPTDQLLSSAAQIAADLDPEQSASHDLPTEIYFDGDWIAVHEDALAVRNARWRAIQGNGPDNNAPDCVLLTTNQDEQVWYVANDIRAIADLTTRTND